MEPPRNCPEVRTALPLHVGFDLDPPTRAAVEAHLESCPGCRAALDRARRARRAFLGLDAATGEPPALWPALRERLAAEGLMARHGGPSAAAATDGLAAAAGRRLAPAPARARVPAPGRVLRRPRRIAAAAAALLLVASGLFVGRGLFAPGDGSPDADPGLAVGPDSSEAAPQVPLAPGLQPVAMQPLREGERPLAADAIPFQGTEPDTDPILRRVDGSVVSDHPRVR